MYNELPDTMKEDIIRLLEQHQLRQAKIRHDAWMKDQAWHYAME